MEKEMQFMQICDRVEAIAGAPIDLSAFPGAWLNSNPDTRGIARLSMTVANGSLSVQVFGIGPNGLIDWGETDASVFTSSPASRVGAGFTCRFDFGFAEARLQGMLMKGLLVLGQLHSFKDDSRRLNYFIREYFGLAHGRY